MIGWQSALGTSVLVVLLAITSWVALRHSTLSPASMSVHHKTGSARGIRVWQMRADGRPAYHADIARAVQFSDDTTDFSKVTATVLNYHDAPPWHLSADQGRSLDHNNKVNLWGHVQAYRHQDIHNRALTFKTSQLTVLPNDHIAKTAKPVTIYQPGTQNITHAVGMKAYTDRKIIHLLSKVRSTYESQATKDLQARS